MFSEDQLAELIKVIMAKQEIGSVDQYSHNKYGQRQQKSPLNITASQALVILGLLSGALQVSSILLDREQSVQLVLSGSLKKNEQTELDRIMGQIAHLPFDEVVKAMMGRLK